MRGCAGSQTINADASAAFLQLELDWDPMDVTAAPWLSQMRAALTAAGGARGITMSISGHSADAIDSFTLVRGYFPTIIFTTAAVVLVFVGVAFRSPFIPLRSVFTIALTLLFVCVADWRAGGGGGVGGGAETSTGTVSLT